MTVDCPVVRNGNSVVVISCLLVYGNSSKAHGTARIVSEFYYSFNVRRTSHAWLLLTMQDYITQSISQSTCTNCDYGKSQVWWDALFISLARSLTWHGLER